MLISRSIKVACEGAGNFLFLGLKRLTRLREEVPRLFAGGHGDVGLDFVFGEVVEFVFVRTTVPWFPRMTSGDYDTTTAEDPVAIAFSRSRRRAGYLHWSIYNFTISALDVVLIEFKIFSLLHNSVISTPACGSAILLLLFQAHRHQSIILHMACDMSNKRPPFWV